MRLALGRANREVEPLSLLEREAVAAAFGDVEQEGGTPPALVQVLIDVERRAPDLSDLHVVRAEDQLAPTRQSGELPSQQPPVCTNISLPCLAVRRSIASRARSVATTCPDTALTP